MSVFKDEFILGQSETKSLSGVAEAIRMDLILGSNPHLHSGTVTGRVGDKHGSPVADAAVVIFDENYGTVSNTITGTDGSFIFSLLKPGTGYHTYAKAPGFALAGAPVFDLKANQTVEVNLTLVTDIDMLKSIIIGEVQNDGGYPVNGASVELYRIEDTRTRLMGITFSNEAGRFLLRDLSGGKYFIKVNAPGYFSIYLPLDVNQPASISSVGVTLKEDIKASKGIVTGIIKDAEEKPLSNADVILYRIGDDQIQTPVAYTRTNHEGIYLFVNVPQGEYRVNSNRAVSVE